LVLLSAVLVTCAGCSPGRPRVEGTVTLDGAPVDGGSINFFQGDGIGSDRGNAPIKGGRYVIEGERARNLTPGAYTVRITWIQLLRQPSDADANPPARHAIPPQYNTKSTLTREVKAGTNELNFALTSK
jgi:hypothetical protein